MPRVPAFGPVCSVHCHAPKRGRHGGPVTAKHQQVRRTLVFGLTWAWGWVLVVCAPALVLKLPQVSDVSSRWVPVWCATCVAAGLGLFACVIGLGFPMASTRVKLAVELLPWFGLGGFALAGIVYGGRT